MSNTYTGKRQTWETKFTYYNNMSSTLLEPGVAINEEFNRIYQKPFNEVVTDKTVIYNTPLTEQSLTNNSIDADLLNFKLLHEAKFENNNPYKFINDIKLRIDKISIQTYNFYDIDKGPDEEPNNERETIQDYTNLDELLPLQIKINNKEIDFGAADGSDDFRITELGYNTLTDEIILDPDVTLGRTYVETYEKDFELSSIPQKFDVEINFNNNIYSSYIKDPFFREFFFNNDIEDRIDRHIYNYASIAAIRIDGRIISTIDYDTPDNQNLTKPKRTVPQTITLETLETLLKKVLPEKEKKELKLSDIIETITDEEAEQLIENLKERRKPKEATNIIEKIKESAEYLK